ncbi:unnamed protein product [Heligmosomoides polygyrus]|uniref:Reverse transcriptase domain-containing protein n=1 Tax=Heligmosomoides polygyrus TaxID=6339 RepID=A0A183FS98_HELPZ|nr:unnamed protein product [Heligmosomoides polygyrus]
MAAVEEMLNELSVAGMKIGLDMNMSKTQFMVNQWCDTGHVRLNEVALQQVDTYVHLGRELNMDNDLAPEIARGDAQHGQPSVRFAKQPIRSPNMAGPDTCFDERTIDGVSVSQKGSRETTGTTDNAMGRLILKFIFILEQENSGKYQDAFYVLGDSVGELNTSPNVPGDSVDVPKTSATVPGDAVDLSNTSATVHGEP